MIKRTNLLLDNPEKIIFKMMRGGNLLLESPDSRQTNFQFDQRGSRCLRHQRFNTHVRRRPFYVLFAFHVWRWSSLFHIGNTDIFRAIIVCYNSVIFFSFNLILQSNVHLQASHLAWRRQLFLSIFYQIWK